MTRKDGETTAFLTARVPRDLLDEFKALAESQDRTVSAEVRRAMKHWITPDVVVHRSGK